MPDQILITPDWVNAIVAGISALVAFLAYQVSNKMQKTTEMQTNFSLYHKRYQIYDTIMIFIADILVYGTSTSQDSLNLRRNIKETRFLFGKEITNHVEIIVEKADYLERLNRKLDKHIPGPEAEEAADKREEIRNWFTNQLTEVPNLFSKYIDFSHISFKK